MATVPQTMKADFGLEIQFVSGTADPGRVFRTMSQLIGAFELLDRQLIRSIDLTIEPILLLEDVESGSLKTWLGNHLMSIDDSALKDGDWKKVIGHYLVRAKYVIIDWTQQKAQISSQGDIVGLESQLLEIARETNVLHIPAYEPVQRRGLLNGIQEVGRALAHLERGDSASLITHEGRIAFNMEFSISADSIDDLTVAESISHAEPMILKVKKPDFLGESKWEFVHDTVIEAKILDIVWLKRFQEGAELILPGDSIRAEVFVQVNYGYQREVVSKRYEIVRVLEVMRRIPPEQHRLT
jgi:hypothetical protein